MSDQSYDYSTREGIRPISWADFHGLCQALALAIAPFQPEIVLPVGRGGFYPGTLLAHMLRVEIYPVRLSRRLNDEVVRQTPEWLVEPPPIIRGRRVLVVDEISSSGETLQLAMDKAAEMGAAAVRSAVLYAHSWGAATPDYIGLVSDALLLNPWDREAVINGAFQFHPEYVAALAEQGLEPDESLRVTATPFTLAKGGPPADDRSIL